METNKTVLVELTESQINAITYCVNVVNLEAMRDGQNERRGSYRRPEYLAIVDELPDIVTKLSNLGR